MQKYDIIKNFAKYGAQRNTPVVRAVRRVGGASFWYWNNSVSLNGVREHTVTVINEERKAI
jgi:hypothetical protein